MHSFHFHFSSFCEHLLTEYTDAKLTSKSIEGEEFRIELNGTLHLLTEKSTKEVVRSYLELVLKMHNKTEQFGIQELQPLLCT